MSASGPTAAGSLAQTPLATLLASGLDRRLTGTLVLEEPSGDKSAVAWLDGAPAKAKTADPVITLGRLLLKRGSIDEAVERDSREQAERGKLLHGAVLLARQSIEPNELVAALAEQVLLKVSWLFSLAPETRWGFYADVDFLKAWGAEPTPVDPLAAIWRGVREHATDAQVAPHLAALAGHELRLHAAVQPQRFGFSAKDRALVDVLRARPYALADFLDTGLAERAVIERFVYVLAVTRSLDLGNGLPPVGASAAEPRDARRTEPAVPRSTRFRGRPGADSAPSGAGGTDDEQALRAELNDRVAALDRATHYQVLGVPESADGPQLQAAFFQLAKRWHPDRIPAALADVREAATRLFARINEAHAVLSGDTRAAYDAQLARGSNDAEEQEQVRRVLSAAVAFQKAEVLVRRKSYAAARTEAQHAMENDPSQPEYAALFAWIAAQDAERGETRRYDDLIAILTQSSAADPKNLKMRIWKAQVLGFAGKAEEAVREYRRIVELDPRNVDAQREIRLHTMRKERRAGETSPPSSKGAKKEAEDKGGLFGKLFKR